MCQKRKKGKLSGRSFWDEFWEAISRTSSGFQKCQLIVSKTTPFDTINKKLMRKVLTPLLLDHLRKDWSPTGRQTFTIRWLSVHPDWNFSLAPNEENLGWRADLASKLFDKSLIGNNDRNGFLREYQPIVHFLPKEEFESLGGGRIDPSRIPVWR